MRFNIKTFFAAMWMMLQVVGIIVAFVYGITVIDLYSCFLYRHIQSPFLVITIFTVTIMTMVCIICAMEFPKKENK